MSRSAREGNRQLIVQVSERGGQAVAITGQRERGPGS